jgi:hypothetical protein
MVPLLVKAIASNEAYRRSITGAFDHLLIDEYQDVNPGQVALIDQFVDDGVKLWVVGDDDQTLYAFRASDIRYILEFKKNTQTPKCTCSIGTTAPLPRSSWRRNVSFEATGGASTRTISRRASSLPSWSSGATPHRR